jgi:hypothetical protein
LEHRGFDNRSWAADHVPEPRITRINTRPLISRNNTKPRIAQIHHEAADLADFDLEAFQRRQPSEMPAERPAPACRAKRGPDG